MIKVATRSDLARRWHDLMDVNAGTIADGTPMIEDVGWQLSRLMLPADSTRAPRPATMPGDVRRHRLLAGPA